MRSDQSGRSSAPPAAAGHTIRGCRDRITAERSPLRSIKAVDRIKNVDFVFSTTGCNPRSTPGLGSIGPAFPTIAGDVMRLPASEVVMDGEVILHVMVSIGYLYRAL